MRLLAIFAHPDDELGCVGTLAKHAARGDTVMLAWTTHGELASQFVAESEAAVRDIRRQHGAFVASEVGAEHHFFDMGDSRMEGSRDEALEVARLYARFKPDAVITWDGDSGHPDHRATARIAFDAITLARIPKIVNEGVAGEYEPHRQPVKFHQYVSSSSTAPRLSVDISEQIEVSVKLFGFYQQFYGWKHSPDQFRESRANRGREAGVAFAESFQLRGVHLPAVDYLK